MDDTSSSLDVDGMKSKRLTIASHLMQERKASQAPHAAHSIYVQMHSKSVQNEGPFIWWQQG